MRTARAYMKTMKTRTPILALLAALALPTTALAKSHTYVPPGNSGANQYVEVIPTAGGGTPSGGLHHRTAHSRAGQGAGAVAPSTLNALAGQGATGQQAAAVALATAPAGVRGIPSSGTHHARAHGHGSTSGSNGSGGAGGSGSSGSSGTGAGASSSSPVTQLAHALTGSAAGGLGSMLPALLIAVALGMVGLVIMRRRGHST